jgi:hypothetical protein
MPHRSQHMAAHQPPEVQPIWHGRAVEQLPRSRPWLLRAGMSQSWPRLPTLLLLLLLLAADTCSWPAVCAGECSGRGWSCFSVYLAVGAAAGRPGVVSWQSAARAVALRQRPSPPGLQ